jgi:hypothetical protein
MIAPAAGADELVEWAERAAASIDWSGWVADPADPLVSPRWFNDAPPLTLSLTVDYAAFEAWLAGRARAASDVERVQAELAERWTNAAVYDDFGRVNDVLAGVLLWGAVQGLPAERREAVRQAVIARREAQAASAAAAPAAEPGPGAVDVGEAMETSALRFKFLQDMLAQQAASGFQPPKLS